MGANPRLPRRDQYREDAPARRARPLLRRPLVTVAGFRDPAAHRALAIGLSQCLLTRRRRASHHRRWSPAASLHPTSDAMATISPAAISTVEVHNTPIRIHADRALSGWMGGMLRSDQDSIAGSARRNAAEARSISAIACAKSSGSSPKVSLFTESGGVSPGGEAPDRRFKAAFPSLWATGSDSPLRAASSR